MAGQKETSLTKLQKMFDEAWSGDIDNEKKAELFRKALELSQNNPELLVSSDNNNNKYPAIRDV